jgi:hypothetical protein
MEIREAVDALERSSEFKNWKKSHKKAYFADAFVIIEGNNKTDWQLGYYDKKSDKITVFVTCEKIIVKPEEEVFKKGGAVRGIDLKRVKKDLKDALRICGKLCKENYSGEDASKAIVVLQSLDIGQVWNITYITNRYNALNIKLDAETGKVLMHDLASMFDFVKK